MPEKPILAIDVDGVLNALSQGPRPARGWEDHRVTIPGAALRIRCNAAHGPALLALAAEHDAELTWLTFWEDLANEHIGPLAGLPSLPVVPLAPGMAGLAIEYRSVGDVKARSLRAYAGSRPACWLDDEADAAACLASWETPHLVVRVDDRAGLQDHHLRKARRWLASLSREAAHGR